MVAEKNILNQKKSWPRTALIAGGECRRRLTQNGDKLSLAGAIGGRSSMVEPQIVVLAVAGSNPVGHPKLPL